MATAPIPSKFAAKAVSDPAEAEPRLVPFLFESLRSLPASVLCVSVASNVLSLFLPFAMMQVYDRVLPNNALETLAMLMLAVAVAAIVDAVIREARGHVTSWRAAQLAWLTREEAMRRIGAAPPAWLNAESPARIAERLKALVSIAEWQGSQTRLMLLDLPFVALFMVLLIIVGGPLVLIPIFLTLLVALVAVRSGSALHAAGIRRDNEDLKTRDFLTEVLSAISTVKGSAMEAPMLRRYERLLKGMAPSAFEYHRLSELSGSKAETLSLATQVIVVTSGAALVVTGSLSLGALTCCTLLTGRIVQPLIRVLSLWNELQSLLVAHAKARRILLLPAAPAKVAADALPDGPAAITISGISFGYEPGKPILENASLAIPAGGIAAIRGPDGIGKSALARLIVGRLAPDVGTVRIGEVDPSLAHERLRGRVAMVSVDNRSIRGTILENIAMFRVGPALDAARAAARLIGLETDVNRLPLGFDTPVADGGGGLPEGLLQRIAIARAIARSPSVLVLDEANGSVDIHADKHLLAGLAQLRGRTTLLIITNRPSMSALADSVYTIKDRAIVALPSERMTARPQSVGAVS